MKLFNHYSVVTALGLTFLFTAVLTGCKNSAAGHDEEEHFPVGAVLKMNGQDIVRYEDGTLTGTIEVAEANETALISIYFIEENGEEFQPSDPDYSLTWAVEDTSIADVEQHPDDGRWRFHVVGSASGSTTVTFELLHAGHSDFEVTGIPINVN